MRIISWNAQGKFREKFPEIRKLSGDICEVCGSTGYIRTAYTYSPYGQVTADGSLTQPIQWSSEYNDTELCLIYYNYRHYNPMDGRWTGRDLIHNRKLRNRYIFCERIINSHDILGLIPNEEISLVFESMSDSISDKMVRWWYKGSVQIDKKEDFSPDLYPCNENQCIKKLIFIAHGEKSVIDEQFVNMHLRDGSILMESARVTDISKHFKGFRYCKSGCLIELIVCYLGVLPYLKRNIEDATGCKVKLYDRRVNALFPNLNLPGY